LSRQELIERERRWAPAAAIAAFGAFAMLIGSAVASEGGSLLTPEGVDSTTNFLRSFRDNREPLLISFLLRAGALLLFVPPLYYLFQAAVARNPGVRRGLVGILIAGPTFLAAAAILQWVAFDQAATDFLDGGGGTGIPVGEYAEDLISDQAAYGIVQGLTFGGVIGFVVGIVYTALQAMRAGLLTRFFGTLGMALGAALVLLGQAIALLALAMWFAWLGLLYLGRVPGGRPPAWEEGKARPWPKPGEEEPADPSEFSADGEEGDMDEGVDAETALAQDAETPHAGRRERARKRKRKRRR
jgi:hypothetical protein